jgi:hypothetical protein
MTIIGETYQVNGTAKNAYCRSHRPIASSECYGSAQSPCEPPVCNEEENIYHFCSYGTFGLKMSLPLLDYISQVFICENI